MTAYSDAVPGDAARLSALAQATFTETFGHLYRAEDLAAFLAQIGPARWRAELADPAFRVRIAEADGAAIGFAKLGPSSLPVEPRGASAELRQLYVLRPWHGTGVAAALMDWAIATARGDGALDLYLSVFVDNARAKRFYARYGFERVGRHAFMVGAHTDEDDVMRMAL